MKLLVCFIFIFSCFLKSTYGHQNFVLKSNFSRNSFYLAKKLEFKKQTPLISFLDSRFKLKMFVDSGHPYNEAYFSYLNLRSYKVKNSVFYIAKESNNSKMNWPNPPMLTNKRTSNIRKTLSIISLSGLSGAVLGLSTISFSTHPEKASSNITVGFAIGVLLGSLFAIYKTIRVRSQNESSTQFDKNIYFHHSSFKNGFLSYSSFNPNGVKTFKSQDFRK